MISPQDPFSGGPSGPTFSSSCVGFNSHLPQLLPNLPQYRSQRDNFFVALADNVLIFAKLYFWGYQAHVLASTQPAFLLLSANLQLKCILISLGKQGTFPLAGATSETNVEFLLHIIMYELLRRIRLKISGPSPPYQVQSGPSPGAATQTNPSNP